MSKLRRRATRKAARMTARHALHGTATRTRRAPFRTGGLLAVGAALGGAAGWLAARTRGTRSAT